MTFYTAHAGIRMIDPITPEEAAALGGTLVQVPRDKSGQDDPPTPPPAGLEAPKENP